MFTIDHIVWVDNLEELKAEPDERIIVFSPNYSEGNEMRFRFITANLAKFCTDVRAFARISSPVLPS